MSESHSYFPTTRLTIINDLRDPTSPAWEIFFRIYGPIIYRFARKAGLPEHDADDVMATVISNFAARVRKGDFRVDHEKGLFRQYLRTMTNRVIRKYQQGRARMPLSLDDISSVESLQEPDDPVWNELEKQERYRTCVERSRTSGRVSERDFKVFELRAIREQPVETVACQFGISTGRVHGIKSEVLNHIRELKKELDEILGEV